MVIKCRGVDGLFERNLGFSQPGWRVALRVLGQVGREAGVPPRFPPVAVEFRALVGHVVVESVDEGAGVMEAECSPRKRAGLSPDGSGRGRWNPERYLLEFAL